MNLRRIFFGFFQKIMRFRLNLCGGKNINILMFHNVYDGTNEQSALDIQKTAFRDFVECLVTKNASFISIDDMLNTSAEQQFVFTFDDVHESVITNAVPVLNKYNIPFTLFVSNIFVDESGYITSKQINDLKNNPLCTIAYHSTHHMIMRKLNAQETLAEIDSSEFERKYNIACDYFAYPYGSLYACSSKNINSLKKSKYKMAFGTINSSVSIGYLKKNAFYVPRLTVSDITWRNLVK